MDGLVGLKYEVLLGSGGLFDLYNVEIALTCLSVFR